MAKKLGAPMAAQLREAIRASKLSLNQLGQRAGIDHSRLSRFVRGERDLTLDTGDKLCQVLGLHLRADEEQAEEAQPVPPAPAPPPAEDLQAQARSKKGKDRLQTDLPPPQSKPHTRKTRKPKGG